MLMENQQFSPRIFSFQHGKMPGFYFRKRVERIDWRRLASVDVIQIANQMNIDALQENLTSVAFCDITSEIDTRYVDSNFLKLFQLAQLLIEYLLYSQDFLTNNVDALRLENESIKKEAEGLQKRLDLQANRLIETRKECHRRRLLLLAQQQIMDSGPQSYLQCPHCPKAFVNASFLDAHIHRRHPEFASRKMKEIDLNQPHPCASESIDVILKDKGAPLTTNLEQQIHEVLDHLKSQPHFQTPLISTVVQTVEVKDDEPPPPPSPSVAWKRRVAELEEQLREERDRFRVLEDRNRVWQSAVSDEHRMDIERVRIMLEDEIRNVREENLGTQKELIQLRLKKATDSNFGDIEDDVPEQLERQVKSLEPEKPFEYVKSTPRLKSSAKSPVRCPRLSSSSSAFLTKTPPNPTTTSNTENIIEMANNANNPTQSELITGPCECIVRTTCVAGEIKGLAAVDTTFLSKGRVNLPKTRTKCLQTTLSTSAGRESVSIQAGGFGNWQLSCDNKRTLSQEDLISRSKGIIVEGIIVRTEDAEDTGEYDATRSVHLIACGIPAPAVRLPVALPKMEQSFSDYMEGVKGAKAVQIVDDSSYAVESLEWRQRNNLSPAKKPPQTPKYLRRTNSKGEVKETGTSSSDLRLNPLEGVARHKDLMEKLRRDREALKRLREEVQLMLEEQLVDHDVEPETRGLIQSDFDEKMEILEQERLQMNRKHSSFTEIRASLSKQVDRMALLALHAKRERRDSSGSGDSSSLKRQRASRAPERGRPSSLTSITPTLSPIAERRRVATTSPTPKRPVPAQSKQSLFEEYSEEDDTDAVAQSAPRAAAQGVTMSVDVDASSIQSRCAAAVPLASNPTFNPPENTPARTSKHVRLQEVDLRSKTDDTIVDDARIQPGKTFDDSDWDSSDAVEQQPPATRRHQEMLVADIGEDDPLDEMHADLAETKEPARSAYGRNNNYPIGGFAEDDDELPSVSSLNADEQSAVGEFFSSKRRPKTSAGRRPTPMGSDSFRSSGSPLRAGASYTPSSSQWDTSYDAENARERFKTS